MSSWQSAVPNNLPSSCTAEMMPDNVVFLRDWKEFLCENAISRQSFERMLFENIGVSRVILNEVY